MSSSQVRGNLDLILMATLRRAPAHGYAIISTLRTTSQGDFDLPEGTIYPALHRLERAGLVASSVRLCQGRRRRIYELAAKGEEELATQKRDWLGFVQTMKAVLA